MSISEERRSIWVMVMSDMLNSICEESYNRHYQVSYTRVTKFHASRPPKISIDEYVSRIFLYSNCSNECFLLALIYIERLVRRNKSFVVNYNNVHRLTLTSVLIAAKWFDDDHFGNAYYSRVGGLSCKEMNELEAEFLLMINFNVHVENELFMTWDSELIGYLASLNMLQHHDFTSYDLKDKVDSSYATVVPIPNMVAVSDTLTPIKDSSQVVYGYEVS